MPVTSTLTLATVLSSRMMRLTQPQISIVSRPRRDSILVMTRPRRQAIDVRSAPMPAGSTPTMVMVLVQLNELPASDLVQSPGTWRNGAVAVVDRGQRNGFLGRLIGHHV